jgi:Zn-dependent metalloprotease
VYNCRNQWELRVQLARSEGEGPVGDGAVDKVYGFVGKFRQYLHEALGRNSYDGLGSDLIANVHFGMAYNNAFWDGEEFAAGDGDGSVFTSFASSLDVVAHELGHGVVQTTAGLQYYSQSGALNEHFADVFGPVVTQLDNDQDSHNVDWLIGDEIMGPAVPPGETLRSMAAPGLAYNNPIMGQDPQPDHMNNYFGGPADNQGVHINSGIFNKAFTWPPEKSGPTRPPLSGTRRCKTSGLLRASITPSPPLRTPPIPR